ncbi:DBIRD complex subunit ZNF326 isoform X2 [Microtus pennsylvanicus]|uniref:DBIRD complex subunit ZNF326 isoform X2 n=1 Tax=Microtus pennsylvanicus TaxID=10058 RepID=UPI003F6AA183
MDFEDDYVHSASRNTYQGFNGMDRDYGPGSYGGLTFQDIYLKILLLSASKGLDLMSLTTPGLLWVGEICTDLAMVLMNPNKAASEVVMVVDLRAPTGIALTLSEPAPVGSRGRGTPAYPESTFGSRNYDAFGGPSTGRGRGRGHMGDFGSIHRPGIIVDYQNKSTSVPIATTRGIKRKMMQIFNKPGGTFIKKPKLAKPMEKMNLSKSPAKTDPKNEEEEKRRVEARREKQRRRREKNSEKYGDGYRMAFTCSFCKFRTFEEKDIELHLESSSHQETLDHIQKQTKFDKVVMEFLHECMVNKFKKASIRKQQTLNHPEAYKIIEKDVMEGVTADDHMMKVETVHCSACSVYIPAFHSSVQQHLKSPDHVKGKQAYKEQIKRESVLTATSILNNPIVKARYERFVKGENPFEIQDHSQDQQIEGDEEDEEKIDEPIEEEDEEEEEEDEEVEEVGETEEVEEEEEGGEAGVVEREGDLEGGEGRAESGDDENVGEAENEEEEGKEESACPAEQCEHSQV